MNEIFLVIDTETTGFKRKGLLIQEKQARVCQLAMVLTNSDGKPLAKFSSLIKPDGWTISEGASKVNGLTDEVCEEFGIEQGEAYKMYEHFANMTDVIVAHNADFDKGMMDIEKAYYVRDAKRSILANETPWHCTMKENAHLTGGKSLKNCLQHHCGRDIGEDAHDALVDTEACLDIFFASRARVAA